MGAASAAVDQRLMELLQGRFGLARHCDAIRRYLLLGQVRLCSCGVHRRERRRDFGSWPLWLWMVDPRAVRRGRPPIAYCAAWVSAQRAKAAVRLYGRRFDVRELDG